MTTTRRLAIYLFVFSVLLLVFALSNLWKTFDYSFYQAVYLDNTDDIKLNPNLYLIDLPHPTIETPGLAEDLSVSIFRQRLIDLLDNIATRVADKDRPQAVILDIFFANSSFQRQALQRAIQNLVDSNVRVYAVFNTMNADQTVFEDRLAEHAQELYDRFQGRYLHTSMIRQGDLLLYQSDIEFRSRTGSPQLIEALPQRVARDLGTDITLSSEIRGFVLPLGQESQFDDKTYVFSHKKGATSGGRFTLRGEPSDLAIDEKILLIGSLKKDHLDGVQQAGPKLVAWALDDQMNNNMNAKKPLDQPAFLLAQIVFFSLFVVAVFALLFKYVKAWQSKPALLALVAFIAGTGLLSIVASGLIALNWVAPIGLAMAAMLLAAILSWRYAYKFLVAGMVDGSEKYDVFISYSRKDGDWVVKHLYEPLKALRKADGSELSIFFDRAEIGMGDAFTSKYMWAIIDSRFFIPVFSGHYYGRKSHGRNEMDLAYKRAVEKKIVMLPITHAMDAIPEIYSHLNFTDVIEQPAFFEHISANILEEPLTDES